MNALADVTEEKYIGKYRIIQKLGAGSTGNVYRAHDPFRKVDVAIKVFDPRAFEDSGDELTRSGFFAEAALLGKLDHPHVVQQIANEDMMLLSSTCRGKLEQRFLEILATRLIDVNRRLSHV